MLFLDWRFAPRVEPLDPHAAYAGAYNIGLLSQRCARIEAGARLRGELPDAAELDGLDADLAAATQILKELT